LKERDRPSYRGLSLELEEARRRALEYLARHLERPVLIGQVSLWISSLSYGLNETEALLEDLVEEGVLRLATPQELKGAGVRHAYVLTPAGVQLIREHPPK